MRRPIGFFLIAGVAAMLAALIVYSALKKREAEVQRAIAGSVEIVIAKHDLPLGTRITPDAVRLARWSRDAVPPGAFTDPQSVAGSFVKNSIVENEPIVAAKLFTGEKAAGVMPLLIPAGMRAMSVPVDEVSDIAGFVLPHSRVDVLVAVSNNDSNTKPFSKVVLQNVEVLAVAQQIEGTKDEPQEVKVVTLVVTPEEAERLALASREGTLRLAMRNYNDDKIVLTHGSDIPDMLRAYSPAAPEPPVMRTQTARSTPVLKRPRFEVDIYRDGQTSESLSFINDGSMSEAEPEKTGKSAAHRPPARSAKASPEKAPETAAASAPLPVVSEGPLSAMTEASASPDRDAGPDPGVSSPRAKTIEVP
jgi:pilus assembly protein CpaB